MANLILINSIPEEARVALVENGALAEIHIERTRDRGIAGNIYKGKVVRVLPGMQAAFVDIGLPKAGFLHVSDFYPGVDELPMIDADAVEGGADGVATSEPEPVPLLDAPAVPEFSVTAHETEPIPAPLEERLRRGDEILIQVAKEPLGSKGARITSHISLPGRYLVYLPTTNHLGVSRRIEDETERQRLRDIVLALKPPGAGFIVRTVCVGLSKRELQADMRFLIKLWNRILKRSEDASAPCQLHYDMDLILRSIRDLFTSDVAKVIVDRAVDQQRILDFVDSFAPRLKTRIELHEDAEPLFDQYGIEPAISRALERRVWLKSGGYIVIDQTEALTTIDVNTGRYVGTRNQEETVLKTNLEAAREIVDQLRIRNLGGIIIIDFIDMMDPASRQRVMDAFDAALRQDKMRSNILKISELGLVEMTRKRTRESLSHQLTEPCPSCEGKGRIKSVATIAYEIMRRIRYVAAAAPAAGRIVVRAHAAVAAFLCEDESLAMDALEHELGRRITVEPIEAPDHARFEVQAA
ncbi:MAG: Rne/Rng family ribonuclease [Deltaproteobacteria bacterium]|nr:Rne/Rng family ribonuclease [Deltaproteobacteria bacterium]